MAATKQFPEMHDQDAYEDFLGAIRKRFLESVAEGPLFRTDVRHLFATYLENLPEDVRQHYNCSACHRFVSEFGGLVTVAENGETVPVAWPVTVPGLYQKAVGACRARVASAKITDVFLSSKDTYGFPVTGEWHHMHAIPDPKSVYHGKVLAAGQAAAEKREDRGVLLRSLAEFSKETVERAIPLLEGEALYRSEKVLGVAKWFRDVHDIYSTKRKDHRENLIWKAVATAPQGWCHVKNTMVGTLLEDIQNGLPFEDVAAKFKTKMHPLQYQRPTAVPSAGNVKQAEEIVAKLGIAPSLERRFARLDEVVAVWKPAPAITEKPAGDGIFSHLLKTNVPAAPLVTPATAITWEKFARTVLPTAERIEYRVPGVGPFITLLTAVNPEAPPILRWDLAEKRNPVSWYVYHGGSRATNFNLVVCSWAEVTAFTLLPSMWHEDVRASEQGKGAIALLAGAVDLHNNNVCLFPEILKGELHAVRSTIEAFSSTRSVEGKDEASACGVDLRQWGQEFRVTSDKGRTVRTYKIDRWD